VFDLDEFNLFFKKVTLDSLEQLDELYHPEAEFVDPAHRLRGIPEIREFWTRLLDTLISCETDVLDSTRDGPRCYSRWSMRLRHPKLKRGRPIEVSGMSALIIEDEKVIRHQDFYCMGELLYEHLPVLGTVVRAIKRSS